MCLDVFLAINILALEGSLPFFLDNYHPLKLYANLFNTAVFYAKKIKRPSQRPRRSITMKLPRKLRFLFPNICQHAGLFPIRPYGESHQRHTD